TRSGKYTYIEYARFADDLVILIDAYPRHDWLMKAVEKRLREEVAKLQVEINKEKSRIVDLGRGERFGFLGFDFRRIRSRRGAWRAHYTPQLKKRAALLRKLKDVFRRYQSQPASRVVQLINPVLRGWVNYFAVGHSSECFSMIQDWVEKKIRRHMGRAQNRKGFGWKRWSRQWLYESLQLFDSYRVRRPPPKVAPRPHIVHALSRSRARGPGAGCHHDLAVSRGVGAGRADRQAVRTLRPASRDRGLHCARRPDH